MDNEPLVPVPLREGKVKINLRYAGKGEPVLQVDECVEYKLHIWRIFDRGRYWAYCDGCGDELGHRKMVKDNFVIEVPCQRCGHWTRGRWEG